MQDYELFQMKPGETIMELFEHFTKIVIGFLALVKEHINKE